jgi:hypothetical protein
MKIDAMTLGAVGFAAFAAWYTLKPKPQVTAAQTASDYVFGAAKAQREDVGANIWQNEYPLNFTIYQPIDQNRDYYGLRGT